MPKTYPLRQFRQSAVVGRQRGAKWSGFSCCMLCFLARQGLWLKRAIAHSRVLHVGCLRSQSTSKHGPRMELHGSANAATGSSELETL